MSITCLFAWVLLIVTLPAVLLLWATESQEQRVRRLHRSGLSQAKIAERLGLTRYKVRKALA